MTTTLPPGLIVEGDDESWRIVHVASGLPVLGYCASKAEARRVAAAMAGVDWTRSAEAIQGDDFARSLALRVASIVYSASSYRSRRTFIDEALAEVTQ